MKKILLTFVLLVGIVTGLFAQNLTYQAVIRDNNQQLVVNTDVKATVIITFTSGDPYRADVNGSTNIHGLLSIEFGDAMLNGRDWTGATIAVKVVKANEESVVYVNDDARPVSAVPYALSVDGQFIQNYLTAHNYVDKTELDSRHYLTSDSTVITTMRKDISTNTTNLDNLILHSTKAAIRDSVAGQIHDSIANIASLVEQQVLSISNDTIYLTGGSYVKLPVSFSGDYNDLTNKPTNVSAFNNDAGYLTTHISKDAIRDSVADQIHDSIANVAVPFHTHSNKDLLDTYDQNNTDLTDAVAQKHTHDNASILAATTAPYTNADSVKLDGIAEGAEVNVQADWNQTDNAKDDYIKNKPTIPTVPTTVSAFTNDAGYITNADVPTQVNADWNATSGTAQILNKPELFSGDYNDLSNKPSIKDTVNTILDTKGYLTSASDVITNLQSNLSAAIDKEKTDSTTLAGRIDALENASKDCNDVKSCIASEYTSTADLNTLLQQLTDRINAKIDSLSHIVDSLSNVINNGEETDGQPCPGTATVSDIDGNIYSTMQIGSQCWMSKNLRTKTHQYGQVWTNTDADPAIYGRYYDWEAVMQVSGANSTSVTVGDKHKGICPTGWHVPSFNEWDALNIYVNSKMKYKCEGSDGAIAKALSSTTDWDADNTDCAVGNTPEYNNKTGFGAVPAGYYLINQDRFRSFGQSAPFWSTTEYDEFNVQLFRLTNYNSGVITYNNDKSNGFSVRCVRNAETGGGDEPDTPGGDEPTPCLPTSSTHNIEISTSQLPYTFDDTTFLAGTTAGIYTLHRTNAAGCDSIITINLSFISCGTVTDVDNNEYNTVIIGDQCWMKENLRTTKTPDSVAIESGIWTEYAQLVGTFGRLYSWTTVMNGATSSKTNPSNVQGICPTDWHVPSDAEWAQLTDYVSNQSQYCCNANKSNIAKALSSATGWWSDTSSDCNVGNPDDQSNTTGFSALPAGYHDNNFHESKYGAFFWSSTMSSFSMKNDSASVGFRQFHPTSHGLSVRCVRN